jgi:hypothetical protein
VKARRPARGTHHREILIGGRERLEQARLERAVIVDEDDDLTVGCIDADVALPGRTRIARQ